MQWVGGGGSALVFRIVSYLLYCVVCLAMFRVARLTLPLAAAFAAAALFAVHPVHVEAVAMAVNQGELWVALLSCIAVFRYVSARRAGGALRISTTAGLGALYLLACFFKENAVVLPGLLVAAELFLVPTEAPARVRVRQTRFLYLLLMMLAIGFLSVRTAVLGGNVRGTAIAEALEPQGVGGRLLTMLTVVPEWFRLLLWPAHLQGDYSPQEIVAQNSWVTADTLGVLLLVGAVIAAVAARRRAPAITFGLAWCAIALFPVHNVLVPTGIVLAERTLLLPSIGAMLALGGLGALLLERAEPGAQRGLAVATGLLLILGVYRSTTRHPVWSDQFNYWYVTANHDAPLSYRAHHALAEMYVLANADGKAEQEYRLSIALAPPNVSTVFLAYANRLRLKGHCYPAAELYRRSLAIAPAVQPVRASLVACLIDLGKYQEALQEAAIGLASGDEPATWRWLQQAADSALKAGAPAGSVHLTPPSDSTASLKTGTGQ
ncbi:MAG TPA: hypothetical protein VFU23_06705 [Gemmatimonadales bacterium]|nr:hypothetical protein [Gemmatimonadales bacterium]